MLVSCLQSVIEAGIAHLKTKSPDYDKLTFKELRYGHRKYDPTRGIDYILSLTFKDVNEKEYYKR